MELNKEETTSFKCRKRTNKQGLNQGENGRCETGSCLRCISGADIATQHLSGKTEYVFFFSGRIALVMLK